jgi:hypothetical protein
MNATILGEYASYLLSTNQLAQYGKYISRINHIKHAMDAHDAVVFHHGLPPGYHPSLHSAIANNYDSTAVLHFKTHPGAYSV